MRISRIDSSFSTNFNAKWHTKKPLPIKNPKNHNCAKGFRLSLGTLGVASTAGFSAVFSDKPLVPILMAFVGAALGGYGYLKGEKLDEIVEEGKKEEEEFKRIHHLSDKN